MELFLLFSVLIIPVLLLASPIPVFTLKGRADIAVYYLYILMVLQAVILGAHWEAMTRAAGWVMILVGVSCVLGCFFTWHKTQVRQWLQYSLGAIAVNVILILVGIQYFSLSLI